MEQTTEIQTVFVEGLVLPIKRARAERACRALIACLREDCRMTLSEMSRRTGVPGSTLCDQLHRIRQVYDFQLIIRRKEPRLPALA